MAIYRVPCNESFEALTGVSMIHAWLQHSPYLGMLVLLVAAGIGFPFPEDVTLITAGYLAHKGVTSLIPSMVLGYVGVVLGDVILFRIGRALGPKLFHHPRWAKLFSPERHAQLDGLFRRRGVFAVVIARHVAGVRLPAFLMAGTSEMPIWKFIVADGLSAVVSAPLFVVLGYEFGDHLEQLKERIHQIELWVAIAVLMILFVSMARRYWHKHNRPFKAASSK